MNTLTIADNGDLIDFAPGKGLWFVVYAVHYISPTSQGIDHYETSWFDSQDAAIEFSAKRYQS